MNQEEANVERTTIAVDLAKSVFEVAVANERGQIVERNESPQTRVGRGGADSMPPQQRNSIEMSAPWEWKP